MPSPIQRAVNEAVRRACEEGGYRWKIDVTLESMLLDPLWWQALGKSLGCTGWKEMAIPFFWDMLNGKSPEDFFKDLLTNKN